MLTISPTLSSVGHYYPGLTKLTPLKIDCPTSFIANYNKSFFAKAFGNITKDMVYYKLPKGGNFVVDTES